MWIPLASLQLKGLKQNDETTLVGGKVNSLHDNKKDYEHLPEYNNCDGQSMSIILKPRIAYVASTARQGRGLG